MAQHAAGIPASPLGPMTSARGFSMSTHGPPPPPSGPPAQVPTSTILTHSNTPPLPTTTRSYNLDKLTGLNYLTWATRMTPILKQADLWDTVSGITQPTATNNADWMTKDLQAQAELMFHLGDSQVQMARRCKTSAEIWATTTTMKI